MTQRRSTQGQPRSGEGWWVGSGFVCEFFLGGAGCASGVCSFLRRRGSTPGVLSL